MATVAEIQPICCWGVSSLTLVFSVKQGGRGEGVVGYIHMGGGGGGVGAGET